MAREDARSGNDFFKHLEQPSAPPQPRKLKAAGDAPRAEDKRPVNTRTDRQKGPGLSPGMPVIPKEGAPPPVDRPRSDILLTPDGVRRTGEMQAPPPRAEEEEVEEPPPDEHEASRSKNIEETTVGWEEYAATDFPAVPGEDLGVKTKMTDSGRVVPVAVRADLTDEALKHRSIKDKSGKGRPPKPAKAPATQPKRAPRSWMGRLGQSLRMKFMGGKIVEEDEEIDEWTEQQLNEETKGFAKSGSQKDQARRKGGPLRLVKNFVLEVVKLVLLVLLLRAYVLQVSEVNGPSMEPTLSGGDSSKSEPADRLVVERVTAHLANLDNRWTGWIPEALHPRFRRGDIIVVRSPENPGSELVKRLIALPGDVIKFENGKLYLKYEGKGEFLEVDESYLDPELTSSDGKTRRSYEPGSLPELLQDGRELNVPDQRIFVMGDNRQHSNDSRRWLDITVGKAETVYGGHQTNPSGHNRLWLHISSIEGRVVFRIYPFNRAWPPVK